MKIKTVEHLSCNQCHKLDDSKFYDAKGVFPAMVVVMSCESYKK